MHAQPLDISLAVMLAAKDRRAQRQAAALARFGKPLVSILVVTPGPIKDGWLPRHVMALALRELNKLYTTRNSCLVSHEVFWESTGPEALHVIDADARELKLALIKLEDRHPIGRLWDLDVLAPGGVHLSRKQLGFPARRCLLCERPARECGRCRRHALPDLLEAIEKLVNDAGLN